MFDNLLHKLYAASISIDPSGAMVVASTRDRFMAWASLFCFVAALSLACYLIWRRRPLARRLSICAFILSLIIPAYIIPVARTEFIRVSEWEMTIDSSNWLMESRQVVDLTDLHILKETRDGIIPGNLMGDPAVHWQLSWKNGRQQTLELNDFFNAHRFVVAHYIRDRGYRVEWLEGPVDLTF